MLFSSCCSAQNALPSVPCDEVYGIPGPYVCGSDPLLPTEWFPEKVQEQNQRVNSAFPTCAFFFRIADSAAAAHLSSLASNRAAERLDPPRPSVEDVVQQNMNPPRFLSVRRPITLTLFLLASIALYSSAQDTTAPAPKTQTPRPDAPSRLTIEVTGGDNNVPVENASVYVKYIEERKLLKDKKLELNVKTSREGIAHVTGAKPGRVLIQIVADGWKTFGRWFDITDPKQTIKVHLDRPPKWY
jgi:hypothetical protein